MEKQHLTTLSSENLLSYEDSKQNLVNFLISDEPVTPESLTALLPSIYSYTDASIKQNGSLMPNVIYNTIENNDSTIAFVNFNELSFNISNPEFSMGNVSTSERLNLLKILFHEHSHLGDYNNPSIKNTFDGKVEKKREMVPGTITPMLQKLKEKYPGGISDTSGNFVKRQKLMDSLRNYNYSTYYQSPEEVRARQTAIVFCEDIVDSAKEQLDNSPESQQKRETLENTIITEKTEEQEHSAFVETLTLTPDLKDELLPIRKELLVDFYNAVDNHLAENNINPNSSATIESSQKINSLIRPLNFMLYDDMYNDDIANSLMDTYIQLGQNSKHFNYNCFAYLIESTDFIPSKDQMLAVAEIFQTSPKLEGQNRLDSFMSTFFTNNTSELLDIYKTNNPNFNQEVESYDGTLVVLDKDSILSADNSSSM